MSSARCRPSRPPIGTVELELLNYIQQQPHAVTVREVAQHFADTRGHVRTTVLNVMLRLWRKGFLHRRRTDGVYRYSPSVQRGPLLQRLVGDFVQKVLGGSVSPFMAYLSEAAQLSPDDLRELEALVEQLKRREAQAASGSKP